MTAGHPRLTSIVIGVGNSDRGDDGVGPSVARQIDALGSDAISTIVAEGDLSDLALRWQDGQDVVIVDAMSSGRAPGAVVRIDALDRTLPIGRGLLSSHGVGLAEAIELGRLLDRLPRTLTIFGVEGATFEQFAPMSAEVEAAIPRLVSTISEQLESARQPSTETRSTRSSTSRASQR
jgi:hydrogenase maturation protease